MRAPHRRSAGASRCRRSASRRADGLRRRPRRAPRTPPACQLARPGTPRWIPAGRAPRAGAARAPARAAPARRRAAVDRTSTGAASETGADRGSRVRPADVGDPDRADREHRHHHDQGRHDERTFDRGPAPSARFRLHRHRVLLRVGQTTTVRHRRSEPARRTVRRRGASCAVLDRSGSPWSRCDEGCVSLRSPGAVPRPRTSRGRRGGRPDPPRWAEAACRAREPPDPREPGGPGRHADRRALGRRFTRQGAEHPADVRVEPAPAARGRPPPRPTSRLRASPGADRTRRRPVRLPRPGSAEDLAGRPDGRRLDARGCVGDVAGPRPRRSRGPAVPARRVRPAGRPEAGCAAGPMRGVARVRRPRSFGRHPRSAGGGASPPGEPVGAVAPRPVSRRPAGRRARSLRSCTGPPGGRVGHRPISRARPAARTDPPAGSRAAPER